MTDKVTVWCRLSLAEAITRMIPDWISWGCQIMKMLECTGCIEIILVMGSANDRHYVVTSSVIGWAHNQNQLEVRSWTCWNVWVLSSIRQWIKYFCTYLFCLFVFLFTNCYLITYYGIMDLGQHWLKSWLATCLHYPLLKSMLTSYHP